MGAHPVTDLAQCGHQGDGTGPAHGVAQPQSRARRVEPVDGGGDELPLFRGEVGFREPLRDLVRPLPAVGVDLQGAHPVVQLGWDSRVLERADEPVHGRRHRVVRGEVGDLVVGPAAQRRAALAGAGRDGGDGVRHEQDAGDGGTARGQGQPADAGQGDVRTDLEGPADAGQEGAGQDGDEGGREGGGREPVQGGALDVVDQPGEARRPGTRRVDHPAAADQPERDGEAGQHPAPGERPAQRQQAAAGRRGTPSQSTTSVTTSRAAARDSARPRPTAV